MAKRLFILFLAVLLLPLWAFAEGNDVCLRIDRDNVTAWKGRLANARHLNEERMSGCAQFSVKQFEKWAAALKKKSGNVWIVDCRLETHGFINGIAVSWANPLNNANLGKTAAEVEDEEAALASLVGTTVSACTMDTDPPAVATDFIVETWQTERELVEAQGFGYLRLACPDHIWPPAGAIDEFIAFAKDLPEDAWLCFHCHAGSGRTGAFMTIWEMMQKPDAPLEDILRHQAETGSSNLLDRSASDTLPGGGLPEGPALERKRATQQRIIMVRAMHMYIRENCATNYAVTWSDWLAARSRTEVLQVGQKLEGEGMSSDPLVVSDALEALAPGRVVVLSGDTVLFITVE
jgi:hypothetical protein